MHCLGGLIWMVPWEGSDSGGPMGVSASPYSGRQGRLAGAGGFVCNSHGVSYVQPLASRPAKWLSFRITCRKPSCQIGLSKESPRETVWIFYFHSGQHLLTHALQVLIIELVLHGFFFLK